jgi:hypothetical protein
MESDDALLLKAGRNLLLFQKAEHLMKVLSYISELVSPLRGTSPRQSTQEMQARRAGIIANETLGQVTRTLQERSRIADDLKYIPKSMPEFGIAATYTITRDKEAAAAHCADLDELLKARNAFIHRLYPRLLKADYESRTSLLQDFDDDYARFTPFVAGLEAQIDLILQARQKLAEFLASDEGKAEFLRNFDRDSPVTWKLAELYPRLARADSWASLNQAVHEIQISDPSLIEKLKSIEGRTPHELLLATGDFEFREQPGKAGRIRVLYRPLPHASHQWDFTKASRNISATAAGPSPA